MTNSQPKTKILFCDFYGVLSWSHLFSTLPEKELVEKQLFADNKTLLKAGCLNVGDKELCQILSERTGLDYDYLLKHYYDSWDLVDWNEEYIQMLKQYKNKYILVLISDNFEAFSSILRPKLSHIFNQIIGSFDLKQSKSNPNYTFYKNTALQYSSDLKDCILVDDTLKNRLVFESFGGKSFESMIGFFDHLCQANDMIG
jgi:FMN phosphatase YigB (HAD superfamily)